MGSGEYDATVEAITSNGYHVAYDGWGNKEEVKLMLIALLSESELRVFDATIELILDKHSFMPCASVQIEDEGDGDLHGLLNENTFDDGVLRDNVLLVFISPGVQAIVVERAE
ncbi:uncharacterized protein A4U43_C03F570 [Asparagus officinalis]|uniref:Tudor domain-containing protein n=1 Tax=Asparagus officinalis TaxID=4686 RepID=A0A5P1F671_ASPOF|nr:uncharacterized protein A4U43_C03F570 [Asparagus officinalis]